MNKRIQALMEQAMELVDPYALEGEFGPQRLNEQKFAELIAAECSNYLWANEVEWTHNKEQSMLKHFGVRE